MAGFLQGLGQFARQLPAAMYPGLGASGTDPYVAQQARAQAMMQMGAGMVGGQPFGQAYGLGQASGNDVVQSYQRQQTLDMAQQDRASDQQYRELLMKDREAKMTEDQTEKARRAQGDAILSAPLPDEPKKRSAELKKRADALRTIGDARGASLIGEAYNIDSDLMQRENAVRITGNMSEDNARARRAETRQERTDTVNLANARAEAAQRHYETTAKRAADAQAYTLSIMPENDPRRAETLGNYRKYAGKDWYKGEYGGYASGGLGSGAGGLQIGTIEDGYEYLGGDPKIQTSWRKVQ